MSRTRPRNPTPVNPLEERRKNAAELSLKFSLKELEMAVEIKKIMEASKQ